MSLSRLASGLATALLVVAGCTRPNEFIPPPPPEVDGAYPTTGAVSDYLEFTGSTVPVQRVEIRPQVSGKLESVRFEDGAFVKAGDLLFVIEQAPFQATLAQANAAVEQATAERERATAELELAQARLQRRRPLAQGGTLSGEEYEVAASAVETAQAAVNSAVAAIDSAQAAVTQAQLNLEYTEVRSPIDGRIGRRLVDPGNLVQAQMTALTVIETVDPVYAYFNVSDRDVLRLLELEDQYGGRSGADLYLSIDGENFPYKGTIDWTDLGVDPDTRTQLRRGVFQNADGRLLSGLFVRVRLQIADAEEKVLIEERAIAADQRGNYVLVLAGEGEAPETVKVEYRPVKLGIAVGGRRVVESGLAPNELIVVNGLQKARPGGSVRLSKTTPASPAAQAANEPPAASEAESAASAPAASTGDMAGNVAPAQASAEDGGDPTNGVGELRPAADSGAADVQASDSAAPSPAD